MPHASHFGDNFFSAGAYFYNVVLFFVIASLTVCLCLGLPGSNCLQRAKALLILILGLFFGATILVLQFSAEWEVATATVDTGLGSHGIGKFRHNISDSKIRVHLALRGINISLTNGGDDHGVGGFHFNEKFDWAWSQGRDDFGPFAGSFQRQFREAQYSGFPLSILKVANLFVLDGEGISYGRMYRIAGMHTHSLIWFAFIFWIMAVLCIQFSLTPASKFLALSGSMLLLANIVWVSLSPSLKSHPPVVLLESGVVKLQLGPAFYLCLFTGLLAVVLAIALFLFEAVYPIEADTFFGLDPKKGCDEEYCTPEEYEGYLNDHATNTSSTRVRHMFLRGLSLDSAHERESLIMRSSTIQGTLGTHHDNQRSNEQVLVLFRRNNTIAPKFFADRIHPRRGSVQSRNAIHENTSV